ncbi:putative F-box/LRR-repeat protein 23 [Lolium rigidum]|uniref:putative F-box/LRR-repeat protein 23 n=1 Tax=Lolium rigidum TaxID=89674 RepID=UPI001F5CEB9B|nr:putative F-box/LRR-repeat protein 23 [Lolium rigidum]
MDAIPERDWAELPVDAILYILRKLDVVDLVQGGVAAVCSSWRRAARDEAVLWRHIDVRGRFPGDLDHLARGAVCVSTGQCENFCGQFLDDDFLLFLADRAPLLRCLRLKFCHGITSEGFAAAITNFPLLEELELDLCRGIDDTGGVFEHVARSCPRMKHITYLKHPGFNFHITDCDNDREALAIASMPELRTLQLFRDNLTNTGLTSIIDNCPHLEFLDLRSCCNISMDDALQAKCSRIKKSTLLPDFKDQRDHFDTDSEIVLARSRIPTL